jgi:Flp pilus assembly protein TadG
VTKFKFLTIKASRAFLRAGLLRAHDCAQLAALRGKEGVSGVKQEGPEGETGATIVEFAVSISVVVMLLFGIIQCSLALFVYNYVCDAARVATRYAIVRGGSCSGMPDCGITSAQIQTFLQGIHYPVVNTSNLTVTTTWLSASTSEPTTWTACATQCNTPGNAVQVQVTYAYPFSIPFWKSTTLNIASASQMVISN